MARMSAIFLLLVTATMAACGGSANADDAAPTKAQARAFAGAVNLTATDVPGFKVSSEAKREHDTAAEKRLEHELLHCVHPASAKGLVEVGSKELERESSAGYQVVQSEVAVARSSALAAKELAIIRSSHARGCMSHYLDLLLSGKYRGATFSPVSIAEGEPPASGVTGSFAWRISVAITAHGVRLPFYVDILGFVYGPAEVSLFAVGLPQPFPAASEKRLFSLLLRRAKSHEI